MTLSYAHPRTANDHLKDGFELRLALSFIAAVVIHTLVFELWPAVQVEAWGDRKPVMDVIPIQQYDLPPAPADLPRPALPMPSAAVADVADVQPWVGWKDVVELPPPPPPDRARTQESGIPITPYQVAPTLLNPAEVEAALLREYPPTLRDAGIGGKIYLLVHIDALGNVMEARVDGATGSTSLEDAALRVAGVFRFRPALNRDLPVAVWIRLPVTFRVR